jgi:hypothetical protein
VNKGLLVVQAMNQALDAIYGAEDAPSVNEYMALKDTLESILNEPRAVVNEIAAESVLRNWRTAKTLQLSALLSFNLLENLFKNQTIIERLVETRETEDPMLLLKLKASFLDTVLDYAIDTFSIAIENFDSEYLTEDQAKAFMNCDPEEALFVACDLAYALKNLDGEV